MPFRRPFHYWMESIYSCSNIAARISSVFTSVTNLGFLSCNMARMLFFIRFFIRMRRKTSPFTAEISGEDCEAVLKTFNFSQAYFAAQYIAE